MQEGRAARAGPFWTLIAIRAAYWALGALSLLWVPLRHGFPPFHAFDSRSDLVFGTFEQWDAGWYLRIVHHGYDVKASTAFFPVYPMAVRLLGSSLAVAILLSLVAAGVGAVALARIAQPLIGPRGARDTGLYVALYPVSFVFTSAYSEGFFLAFAAGAFLAATRNRPWLAGILGGFAVGTRLAGLALLPPLLYLLWPRGRSFKELARPAPLLLLPAALGAYMLYLRHRFGSALAFQDALDKVWNRHTSAAGPFGGLWHALYSGWQGFSELGQHLPRALGQPGGYAQREVFGTWNAVHLAVLVAALWLTWIVWQRLGPALGLYAISIQVILLSAPVDVVPLASYPRYLLYDFPLFIALAAVLRDRPRAREATLIAFAALGAVAAVAFSHGIWIA
ncbi:MAG: hypothetical protein QOE95_1396 [Gaiellaceae bacterium]|nr:hypothetical protein [Gaiellaceae bacterium]